MTNGWKTAKELEVHHSISRGLIRTWFDRLEAQGIARRAVGGRGGTLLFSPEAITFLESRKGKYGKPKQEMDELIRGKIFSLRSRSRLGQKKTAER